jgi:hypothetical protein
LAGTPAIPDILTEQIGARRHGRVTGIAFVHFLLDRDGFLNCGEVAHHSRREHRRRRRSFKLGCALLQEGLHVREKILRAVALRKADIAVRELTTRPTFHVTPPLPKRGLRQHA